MVVAALCPSNVESTVNFPSNGGSKSNGLTLLLLLLITNSRQMLTKGHKLPKENLEINQRLMAQTLSHCFPFVDVGDVLVKICFSMHMFVGVCLCVCVSFRDIRTSGVICQRWFDRQTWWVGRVADFSSGGVVRTS